jgi:hypothetical protein
VEQQRAPPGGGNGRQRSPLNFLVNHVAGLIAYCHQPKKPPLDLGLPARLAV